jgi:hypothetical protein
VPVEAGTYPVGSAPRRLLLARLQYARALSPGPARELADRAVVDYFRDADPVIAEAYDAVGRAAW